MNREISNITIVAAGKGGYEIACLLKNEHFFSDAIIIVCDVSREFIDSVSSKVDKAILLPDLKRMPFAADTVMVEPIFNVAKGRVVVTSVLNEISGRTFAPLIALCALVHGLEVYSSFVIERFTEESLKSMIKIWYVSRLSIRLRPAQVKDGTISLNKSYRPLVESTVSILRLVPPKLLHLHLTNECIQKYIPKQYSKFVYACQPAYCSLNVSHPDLDEICRNFNLNYLNKPMKTLFTPKHEADNVDRLINLYGRHLPELYENLQSVANNPDMTKKAALPLLLCPINDGKDWSEADLKIMVFGRETNNWNNPEKKYFNFDLKESSNIFAEIEAIQEIYNAYFNFPDEKEVKKNAFIRRGPEKFISQLQAVMPGKKIEYLWNNICKIGVGTPDGSGKCCGLTPDYIYRIEVEKFNVVREEIDILKPDVLIFMTGREHGNIADHYIAHHLGDVNFEQITPELPFLHRVKIPGVRYAVRIAEHPSRASNQSLDDMYSAIINDMKCHNII